MILVTGATGNVGSELVPLLERRGLDVRCLLHPGGRTLEHGGVEVVEGDLDDPGSVAAALDGCDRLFMLTPPHPAQVRREMALIDAAARSGVRHVVAVSVMGADPRSPSTFGRWHAEIDAHLLASGLGATFLRPSGFMQVHLLPPTAASEGRWYGMTGDGVHAFIDAGDVAACAASVLEAADPPSGPYEVTGPAAISMPDAARAYGRALGRDVAYVDLSPDQFSGAMGGAGLPPFVVEGLVGLYSAIRAGHAATTTNGVEDLTGRPARRYEDLLDRLVAA